MTNALKQAGAGRMDTASYPYGTKNRPAGGTFIHTKASLLVTTKLIRHRLISKRYAPAKNNVCQQKLA